MNSIINVTTMEMIMLFNELPKVSKSFWFTKRYPSWIIKSAIRKKIFIKYAELLIKGSWNGFDVRIFLDTIILSAILSDRKNIQMNETTRNVYILLKRKHTLFDRLIIFSMLNTIPCNKPQIINLTSAPCQSPPMNIVIIRFLYWYNLPILFPPRVM